MSGGNDATGSTAERSGDPYTRLGVRPFINCCGSRTVHGGSLMLPAVVDAITHAAGSFVNLTELMVAAGRRIALLTGAEAALVTSGGAASLTAAAAGAITKGDPERMLRLPRTEGMPHRVVMPKGARFTYDHAIRATGAEILEVADRAQMQVALASDAVLIATIGTKDGALPIGLEECAALAAPKGIPILLDAASEHLQRPNPYLVRGATMVAYSGGKYLRGPQSTGLLLGERSWIEAARLNAAPHHAIGRPMKVSKEEIVGLVAAIEFWAEARDHGAERKRWQDDLDQIAALVTAVAGVSVETLGSSKAHEEVPRLRIAWDRCRIGLGGLELRETLLAGEPRIMLDDRGATEGSVFILPFNLAPGEAAIVGRAIAAALAAAPPVAAAAPTAPAGDVSGNWEVEIAFAAARSIHRLELTQSGLRLAGTHRTLGLTGALAGTIEGNRVAFTSLHPYEGSNLSYAFSGMIEGAAMAGEVLLGTSGDSAPGPLNMREFGAAAWQARRRA